MISNGMSPEKTTSHVKSVGDSQKPTQKGKKPVDDSENTRENR